MVGKSPPPTPSARARARTHVSSTLPRALLGDHATSKELNVRKEVEPAEKGGLEQRALGLARRWSSQWCGALAAVESAAGGGGEGGVNGGRDGRRRRKDEEG